MFEGKTDDDDDEDVVDDVFLDEGDNNHNKNNNNNISSMQQRGNSRNIVKSHRAISNRNNEYNGNSERDEVDNLPDPPIITSQLGRLPQM